MVLISEYFDQTLDEAIKLNVSTLIPQKEFELWRFMIDLIKGL